MFKFYKAPTATDIESFARDNNVTIHVWELTRERSLPNLVTKTTHVGKSDVHIFGPYFNLGNDYCLENLELVLDVRAFKFNIRNEEAMNIWQCAQKAEMMMANSWLDIVSQWGKDSVGFSEERQLRRRLGFGFEIYTGTRFIK